jgi:hypothetical protein
MKKRLISILATAALCVQAAAMPILANAEASATYITNSDFSDCAVGGAEKGYYGLNIIEDGSPWLSKGSSDRHGETFLHDDTRNVNYCELYSICEKQGAYGAGSFYMYQRDTTSNYTKEYGLCEYDLRMHDGSFQFMFGDFTDPTSSTNYIAGSIIFDTTSITAANKGSSTIVATIEPEKWYHVKVTLNNIFQEYSVQVTDVNGKVVGTAENLGYVQSQATGVRTWCFGYIKNAGPYRYDLTNVTIAKGSEKYTF